MMDYIDDESGLLEDEPIRLTKCPCCGLMVDELFWYNGAYKCLECASAED